MLLGLLLALAPAGVTDARAAQPGVVVVPAGTESGKTRFVVECPAAGGATPSFSVTVDGTPQPTTAIPLLSDRLTLALVVDASQDGGAVLQPAISGVVDLVLGAPAGLRAALVADTEPPVVVTPLGAGPAEFLDGLSAVQPRGGRQTVAALDLAARQLPPEAETPRLVVLHTAAPDAPGRSAADLAAGLSAAGIVLGVVTTATDGGPVPPYWAAATAATGGTAVSARGPEAVSGFTWLAAALRSRYVLTVPAPERLPANVTVRVDAPGGPFTAETVLPAPPAVAPPAPPAVAPPAPPGAAASGGAGAGIGVAAGLGMLVLVVVGVAVARRRARRAGAPLGPVWDVPDRPVPVVDREPLLDAMRTTVQAGTPLVLYDDGPDGLGVTTAMIEFAHRNRHDYDVVWWVAAEDPPLVKDRLAELAELVGLARPSDTAADATDRLLDTLRRRQRWLLLFDDPPGPDELTPLLPTGPGHVVVGSTDPQWRKHDITLPVPPLRRTESVDLLRSRHPGLSVEEADRVAAAADDVPLALVPAGATLAETGMSVDGYLDALSTRRTSANGHTTASSAVSAFAAWEIAADRLEADDPPALALLTFVAWLAPRPVPLALLTRNPESLPPPLAEAREPHGLAERAATLQRQGLVRVASNSLALHPAPAAQIRARSGQDRPGDLGWGAWAVRLLSAAATADPLDPAARPTWRQLLPHVLAATDPARELDEVADDVGRLLQQAGRYLQGRGEARFARALLMDADVFARGSR